MTTVLFAMGVVVVIMFASYLKLPLTTVYVVSLAALAFSFRPLPDPFNSLADLLRTPAMIVQSYGNGLGLGPPGTAMISLAVTFVFDIAVTSLLGWRKR
jgi:hypothetical protein